MPGSQAEVSRRAALQTGAAALGGAAGVLALGGAAWAAGDRIGRGDSADGRPVTIGYLPITDATPLLTAHAAGLYAKHGVTVAKPVMFRSWASLSEAFVSGKVDAVHLLMPMAVYLKYQLGADASVVAWNHTNGSALTLGRGVKDLSSLAGRTVAIPSWYSVHNVILQKMLRAEGLTPVTGRDAARPGQVTLVPMAPSDMIPALDQGVIGGFTVADPFNAMAAVKKVGHIHRFLGDVWHNHACCVTVLSGRLLRERPAQAAGFVAALAEAQSAVTDGASRTRTAVVLSEKKYLPQPLPAITKALTHPAAAADVVRNPDWHGETIRFTPFPQPSYTEELVRAMQTTVTDADSSFLARLDPAAVHRELVDLAPLRATGLALPASRTEEIRP